MSDNSLNIQPLPESHDHVLGFKMSGKLTDADYRYYTPIVDAAVQKYDKVRLLALFHDFHGWDCHAMWDDTKFAIKNFHHIEKVALVGDKKWEHWMSTTCRPFTKASVQVFEPDQLAAAWKWLES